MKRFSQFFIAFILASTLILTPVFAQTKAPTEISESAPKTYPLAKSIAQTNLQPLEALDSIYVPPTPVIVQTPVIQAVSSCGDNSYANFIYNHESGCSLYNPNSSSGACGLGQAYPCSKLEAVCPNMDYACENSFFTSYADKYGGWEGSYNFWVANQWW